MSNTDFLSRFKLFLLPSLCAASFLVACGDSGSNEVPPDAQVPTASFVAPTTVAANAPAAFDASASSSADGSELLYFWDFGNGQRGGGRTIARMFATGGPKSVTLTVIDGSGRSATQSKTVTVTDPSAAAGSVTVEGAVTTLADVAIEGVNVSVVGGSTSGITDAMGKVRMSLGTDIPLTLKLTKSGYADQFAVVQFPPDIGADAYFEAAMRVRDAELMLADAALGGTLTGRDGALLSLPPNALVGPGGTSMTGAVQASITPVDVTEAAAGGFPGTFDGVTPEGVVTPIVSFGVVEYVLTAAGQILQLAPGKTATIEVPVYATRRLDGSLVVAGDMLPFWSLDETTGIWVQEGEGLIVSSDASPSGLAMRATVTHLSWWNTDLGFDPYGPKPRCVYDTDIGLPGANDTFATATICNLLAEFDRGNEPTAAGADVLQKAAAALSARVVGYSRRVVVPIGGGVTIPVPADADIALNATALNGSWTGRSVVNGPFGVQAEELIKMRPIATTGPDAEAIDIPFDSTRSLIDNQVARFTFSGTTSRYARITVSQDNGSSLTGQVRLLRGVVSLGTADFAGFAGQIVALLPADDTYTVEVSALTNAPGAYRLQVELAGGTQPETLTLPFDVTKSVPQLTLYRGYFTTTGPVTAWFAYQQQSGVASTVRVLATDGTVLSSASTGLIGVQSTTVRLPAAGTYVLELAPDGAQASTVHIAGEQTSWEQVAPALEGATTNNTLIDLVTDSNDDLVLGYTRSFVNAGVTNAIVMLRRWTGTAWEVVGTDLAIASPCNEGVGTVAFALDSSDQPVLAYGNTMTGGATFVTARRFSNGAWYGLGPNDGMLPATSTYGGACANKPVIAPGPGGTLAIAYRADNDVVLQRFDGTEWVGIESALADHFAGQNSDFDLAADPSGRLHFVLTAPFPTGAASVVRRLSTAVPPVWELLGPNGGALPQTNTAGLASPRLRFDAAGKPVIGVIAAVGSSVVYAGTAVYRYDGAQWSSTGGFVADSSFVNNGAQYMGFTVSGSEAFMGWVNTHTSQNSPVVQKNTALGWA
ncbi:MAG: PKD domain-containing protein, partial [Polyangiales bacterium]